jgi:polar amino acid transport system substrate-binding protein
MSIYFRPLLIGCLVLAWLGTGLASSAEAVTNDKIIRFNVSPKGYAPFTIVHEDGSHSGIVWDLLTLVAERHGYEVVGVEIPRKRVDDFILEGRIDATARAIEWTDRPERFTFTQPLLYVQEVFFKRSGSAFEFNDLSDLVGKTIVTNLGYNYPQLAPLFASGKAERFDVQHESEMLKYLLAGKRFDLAVAVLQVGLWHIRQQGWQGLLDYAPQPLSKQGFRLVFRKDHQAFVELFNRELKKIEASGEMERILDRYR